MRQIARREAWRSWRRRGARREVVSDAVEEIVETGEVESAPFAETLAIRELLERLPTADRGRSRYELGF